MALSLRGGVSRERRLVYLQVLALGLLLVASFKTFAANALWSYDSPSGQYYYGASVDEVGTWLLNQYFSRYPQYAGCVTYQYSAPTAWGAHGTNQQERSYTATAAPGSCQTPTGTVFEEQCINGWAWDDSQRKCVDPSTLSSCGDLQGQAGTISAAESGTFCVTTTDGRSCEANKVLTASAGGQVSTAYTYTGNYCTAPAGTSSGNSSGACVTDMSGNQTCVDVAKPNCGTFNGTSVCVADVPAGNCTFIPGGSYICSGSAPQSSPPRPATSSGTIVPPDGTVSGTGGTVNIYSPTTINNNGGAVPTGTDGANTGGDYGQGASSGATSTTTTTTTTQNPDGSQTKTDTKAECDPTVQNCGAAASGKLYEKGSKTYEQVFMAFRDRVKNAPIVQGASGFFSVNINGTCPTWTIPAVWVFPAIPIDMQCSQAMEQVWPIISAVLLLVAGFVAWRIAVGD